MDEEVQILNDNIEQHQIVRSRNRQLKQKYVSNVVKLPKALNVSLPMMKN